MQIELTKEQLEILKPYFDFHYNGIILAQEKRIEKLENLLLSMTHSGKDFNESEQLWKDTVIQILKERSLNY